MSDDFWAAVGVVVFGAFVLMALAVLITSPILILPWVAASVLVSFGMWVIGR